MFPKRTKKVIKYFQLLKNTNLFQFHLTEIKNKNISIKKLSTPSELYNKKKVINNILLICTVLTSKIKIKTNNF